MASEWREMPFSQAVMVNPRVELKRGSLYPFVDMGAVSASSSCAFANDERPFEGGGSRFSVGDTLMARITPCLENGKIARFSGEPNTIAHGSTEFIVIRGRAGFSESAYAYYLTKWEGVSGYAIGQMTGTSGRQRVPNEALDHLMVSIPSLPEQRAIAHILGTLDDKIELNRKMNETLEAMARAIFKSWFVDFLPVRAKMAAKAKNQLLAVPGDEPGKWFVYALECKDGSIYIGQTENLRLRWQQHLAGKGGSWTKSHPPKRIVWWESVLSRRAAVEREIWLKTGFGRKWLKKEIAAIASTQTGAKAHVGARRAVPLPKNIADLFPSRLVDSELGEIPEGWSFIKLGGIADVNWGDTNITKKSYVDHGYLAYSAKGPDGFLPYHDFDRVGVVVSAIGANSGYTWLARGKWSCIKNTIRFWATDSQISTEYLFFATHGNNIWPLSGSAQPFISQTDARNLQVLYPTDGIAEEFGKIVETLFAKIEANQRESRTLAALRDTLLPKLISGELRIKDAERFVKRMEKGN